MARVPSRCLRRRVLTSLRAQPLPNSLGAAADLAQVALSHVVGSNFDKDLDIAVVKATNHDPVVPKQKHVVTLYAQVGKAHSGRDAIRHVLTALSERVAGATEWLVVMKCMMLTHRLMRESDGDRFRQTLAEALFGSRGRDNAERRREMPGGTISLFALGGFKDEKGGPEAYEMSGWVRAYALYLEECCAVLNECRIDPQAEESGHPSASRSWTTQQLIVGLPRLSSLLRRLLDCLPKTRNRLHPVAAVAANDLLKEVRLLFRALSDGVINMVDKFFDMPPHEATAALDIYRRTSRQVAELNTVLGGLKHHDQLAAEVSRLPLPFAPPPADFQKVMEDYINGGSASRAAPSQASGGGGGQGPPSDPLSPPVYRIETQAHVRTSEPDFFGMESLSAPAPAVQAAPAPAAQPAWGAAPPQFAAAAVAPPAAPAHPAAAPLDMFDLLGSGPAAAPAPAPAAPQPKQPAVLNLDSLYASAAPEPSPFGGAAPFGAPGYGQMRPGMPPQQMGYGGPGSAMPGMGGPPNPYMMGGQAPFSMPQQQGTYGGMPPQSAYGMPPPQSAAPFGMQPQQGAYGGMPPQSAAPFGMQPQAAYGSRPPQPAYGGMPAAAPPVADPFAGFGGLGMGPPQPAAAAAAHPFGMPQPAAQQSSNPFA